MAIEEVIKPVLANSSILVTSAFSENLIGASHSPLWCFRKPSLGGFVTFRRIFDNKRNV